MKLVENYNMNRYISILFCEKCQCFIEIKEFTKYKNNIIVNCQCECLKTSYKMTLEKLIRKLKYTISILKTNDTIELINNNKKIKFKLNDIKTDYQCECETIAQIYCVDCQEFLCDKCMKTHYYHKTFKYQTKLFLDDTDIEKLEHKAELSYNELKKCNISVKTILIDNLDETTKKSTKIDVEKINKDIEYNDKNNSLLYELLKLLINSFKIFPNLLNYLNLSYFSSFNLPFSFLPYQEGTCNIEDSLTSFSYYIQSNFLIPIQCDIKYFSLISQMYLSHNKCSDSSHVFLEAKQNSENYEPSHYEVHILLILQDNRLLIVFTHLLDIFIYSPLSFTNWSQQPEQIIQCCSYNTHVTQLQNGNILVFEEQGLGCLIDILENKYEFYQGLEMKCVYILELENNDILLLTEDTQLSLYCVIENELYLKGTTPYFDYEFAYQLKNSTILITKEDEAVFLEPDSMTRIATLDVEFGDNSGNMCIEDEKNNYLYLANKYNEFLYIFHTQNYQIESIYHTTNSDVSLLKSCFNLNADIIIFLIKSYIDEKLNQIMFQEEPYKFDMFQISKDKFVVCNNQKIYFYQIN